ncbi:MAG: hypothetical protein U9P00_12375 [Pseudomonadota bacterium]|nr:hypothetical protein [Pseudomonadota bacterium]
MKRFKNILVVLGPEGEDHLTLERAAALARLNRASLHVLVVLEYLPLELSMLVTALHPQELQDIVERKQRERLDKLRIEPTQQPQHLLVDVEQQQNARHGCDEQDANNDAPGG